MIYSIVILFQSIIKTCIFKNLEKNPKVLRDEISIRYKKFNLSRDEIFKFYDSLDIIVKLNQSLIQHIGNLQYAGYYNYFCRYSLPSLAELINIIVEMREKAENHQICEYEFIKFCELYYHLLFHIMMFKDYLRFDFFQFSKEKILPFLQKIAERINKCKLSRPRGLLIKTSLLRKINDIDRRNTLVHFIIAFLKNQNEIVASDQIPVNYSAKKLILLCINIVTRFYLCNRKKLLNLNNAFERQKYFLSNRFTDYLITNAYITSCLLDVRYNIKTFLNENNMNLIYSQFIEQKTIPYFVDGINKDADILKIPQIGYENHLY